MLFLPLLLVSFFKCAKCNPDYENCICKKKSLQETYAPKGICFGCGCLNDNGLKIKSFVNNNTVVCTWLPEKYHEAFPGVLNGGIIGSILDCHSNWAAAFYLMKSQNLKTTPCTSSSVFNKENKNFGCKILILGGSTTEERILHVNEKWTYHFFNAINKNEIVECSAKKNLQIKDLTGAGDLFAGGFLHGLINNKSIRESCGRFCIGS